MSRDREPMSLAELDALCQRVYRTHKWAVPLANDLSRATNRDVAPTQVNQWQSGVRSIPAWVEDVLAAAFRGRYRVWADLALGARKVSEELEARLAAELEADLDPDEAPDMMPGM